MWKKKLILTQDIKPVYQNGKASFWKNIIVYLDWKKNEIMNWWYTLQRRFIIALYYIYIHSYVHGLCNIYTLSQYSPVQWFLHPLSHLPVNLLHGDPSLQCPLHGTHCLFDTYCPSLQTVIVFKQFLHLIHLTSPNLTRIKEKKSPCSWYQKRKASIDSSCFKMYFSLFCCFKCPTS